LTVEKSNILFPDIEIRNLEMKKTLKEITTSRTLGGRNSEMSSLILLFLPHGHISLEDVDRIRHDVLKKIGPL